MAKKRFFSLLLFLLFLTPALASEQPPAQYPPSAVLITPPTAKQGLVYTGEPQGLIDPGVVENGEIMYSLIESSAHGNTGATATDAGTYTVWYRVQGTSSHLDLPPASLTVTIAKAPQPENIPGDITVPEGTALPAVPLPVGWSWADPDQELSVGPNLVTAVCQDSGNYERTEFPLTITVTPEPPGITYEITDITLPDQGTPSVLAGTTLEQIYDLLSVHSVTLSLIDSNGEPSTREVAFQLREGENPDYDPMTGGLYRLVLHFPSLPENIENPRALQTKIYVDVVGKRNIFATGPIVMTVPFGTPLEALPLPRYASVHFTGTSGAHVYESLPTTWSGEEYQPNKSGLQLIPGSLDPPLPIYLENTKNRQPRARVYVLDPPPLALTLTYTPDHPTNQNVVAAITAQDPFTVTNNNGELTYTFTENGSFTFELLNQAGIPSSLTATVDWIDREPPVITLRGENPQTIQKGSPYTELGADLTDNLDPDIADKLTIDSSNLDTGTPGTYTVTYSAADSAGNQARTVRTVTVKAPTSSSSSGSSRPRPSRDPDPEPTPSPDPDPEPTPSASPEPVQPQPCPRDKTCPLSAFSDADPAAWYHDGVHDALERGLFLGLTKTELGPDVPASRAMLATVLYRQAGSPRVSRPSPFEDVPPGSYYAPAVTWAAEQGIVQGYGHGLFGPHDPVTREQLAAILYRQAGSPAASGDLSAFSDAGEARPYALPALHWAVEQKLLSGKGGGLLDPTGPTTRAQLAAILLNLRSPAGPSPFSAGEP